MGIIVRSVCGLPNSPIRFERYLWGRILYLRVGRHCPVSGRVKGFLLVLLVHVPGVVNFAV